MGNVALSVSYSFILIIAFNGYWQSLECPWFVGILVQSVALSLHDLFP